MDLVHEVLRHARFLWKPIVVLLDEAPKQSLPRHGSHNSMTEVWLGRMKRDWRCSAFPLALAIALAIALAFVDLLPGYNTAATCMCRPILDARGRGEASPTIHHKVLCLPYHIRKQCNFAAQHLILIKVLMRFTGTIAWSRELRALHGQTRQWPRRISHAPIMRFVFSVLRLKELHAAIGTLNAASAVDTRDDRLTNRFELAIAYGDLRPRPSDSLRWPF
mmetsp:Transcript_68301/g.177399  ORF Transcript_68301/g.177399 Transcript_68301/m.177399 type:complete len:220 (-) Transcript_68301:156-815(-)